MNFGDLSQLAVLAFLVEALLQTIKPLYDKTKGWNRSALLSIGIGVLVCLLTGADLFKQVGLPIMLPFVGPVLTGIIASRGSNFLHDVFKFMQGKAETQETGMGGVG